MNGGVMSRFKNRTLTVQCECSNEIILLEHDWEDDLYYFSIYYLNRSSSLWNRLRHAWKVLTTGEPYGDQVVLTQEKAESLGDFASQWTINQWLEEYGQSLGEEPIRRPVDPKRVRRRTEEPKS